MASIAERARAEADEAERENPDAEPVEPIEPEEEEAAEEEERAPEPEPITEAMLRAIGEKVGKEDERHEKRLREIYGDLFAGRVPCPLCLQEGFLIPVEPGDFDPDQRGAVLAAMGESGPTHAAVHQTKVRCPHCQGWGQLYTGSRNPAHEYDACLICSGMGTVERSVLEAADAHRASEANGAHVYLPPPAAPAVNDSWGRPPSHERYGVDPQYNGGVW
jgi:hypothetical protein